MWPHLGVWHRVTVMAVVTRRVTGHVTPRLSTNMSQGPGLARALEVAYVALGDTLWAARAVHNWPEGRENVTINCENMIWSHQVNDFCSYSISPMSSFLLHCALHLPWHRLWSRREVVEVSRGRSVAVCACQWMSVSARPRGPLCGPGPRPRVEVDQRPRPQARGLPGYHRRDWGPPTGGGGGGQARQHPGRLTSNTESRTKCVTKITVKIRRENMVRKILQGKHGDPGQRQEADAVAVRLICRLSAQLSICQSNYLDVVKSQTLFFWPNLGKPLFIIFHHSLRLLCSSVHNIKIMGRENHTQKVRLFLKVWHKLSLVSKKFVSNSLKMLHFEYQKLTDYFLHEWTQKVSFILWRDKF